MPGFSFLAVGSEILSGDISETNGGWVMRQMAKLGHICNEVRVVPDRKDELEDAIVELATRNDLLIMSGGLGPTDDDLTREVLSDITGGTLQFDEELWEQVSACFRKKDKQPPESNRKQACRLEGSTVLTNPIGTAPGLCVKVGECKVCALPGVPAEFKKMYEKHILKEIPKTGVESFRLKLFGIGESEVMDRLRNRDAIPGGMEWGTIAKPDGIILRFPPESVSDLRFPEAIGKIRGEFGQNILAEGDAHPVDLLRSLLLKRGLRIGVAESCTGGLLATWLTEAPGSSAFMCGGVVSYSNEVKMNLLGVPQMILEHDGAVSAACAEAMCKGTMKLLQSDVAVSITGIAGPGGGSKDKPVGTVFIATALRGGDVRCKRFCFGGLRDSVRERSCHTASMMCVDHVHGTLV